MFSVGSISSFSLDEYVKLEVFRNSKNFTQHLWKLKVRIKKFKMK